jgi:hypothetical protein
MTDLQLIDSYSSAKKRSDGALAYYVMPEPDCETAELNLWLNLRVFV